MKQLLFGLLLAISSLSSIAQTDQTASLESSQVFGDYRVHFTVFNSTFIAPDIAQAYQLTRGRDRALVNISVTKTLDEKTSLGLPAVVTGTATNLIQQQRSLSFNTINEGTATYYIADFRHTNEETIKFDLKVQPEGVAKPFVLQFTRTLYLSK